MVNPLLFPPALIKRALDDLHAIAGAARRLDAIEHALVSRLDLMRDELRPIQELSAVRSHLEAVRAAVQPLDEKLDGLREEVAPIQQLADVREGIEPLDEDMRQVRESIDEIEPLVKGIGSQMRGIGEKLARMSGDLAPVGELAEKVPGVKRR
jgi:predicted  nucleic acid-binding Zn-ribbon protein